jgi:hypothetical protein
MTAIVTRDFETGTPPDRRACGCTYRQISVMNTHAIGGTTFVAKWVRTIACPEHPEQTPET